MVKARGERHGQQEPLPKHAGRLTFMSSISKRRPFSSSCNLCCDISFKVFQNLDCSTSRVYGAHASAIYGSLSVSTSIQPSPADPAAGTRRSLMFGAKKSYQAHKEPTSYGLGKVTQKKSGETSTGRPYNCKRV